jgi:hypothetical protein
MATLTILPYLQHGDTSELQLRLLLLPRGSPLDPLTANASSFATAHFKFDVYLQQGLEDLPTPSTSSLLVTVDSPPVSTAQPIFTGLEQQFQIDPNPPGGNTRPTGTQVKKHLPLTYQQSTTLQEPVDSSSQTIHTLVCSRHHPPGLIRHSLHLTPRSPGARSSLFCFAILRLLKLLV